MTHQPSVTFRVLITGSRDAEDPLPVWHQLDLWLCLWGEGRGTSTERGPVGFVLIEGEARGVDTHGKHWARSRDIAVEPFPADWRRYGNAAGGIRNRAMVRSGPHLCLAWPGPRSVGTWDCIRVARAAGVATVVHGIEASVLISNQETEGLW